jgi:hypothetical protein
MRKLLCTFVVTAVCLLSFVPMAQSEIVFRPGPGLNNGTDNGSANGGKDSWVSGDTSGTNYGAESYVVATPVSNCNSATAKAYIQFDLSTLPANVQQVFLGVTHLPHMSYCLSNCDADFYFYPVTEPWSETTLIYDNKPPEAAAVYGPINITFPNDFGNREYDITSIYRAWKNNSVPNHGLAIYSPTVGCNNAAVIFYVHSSDATEENNRPYLKIPCAALPPGLISWWGGNGNANDIIGAYKGTLVNGTSFASGKVGQAFSFDGVDDHVFVPNTLSIDGGAEATYMAWVYPAASPAADTYAGLFGAGDSTVPVWTTQQCRLLYWNTQGSPSGTAKFYMDCGTNDNTTEASYIGRITAGDYPIGAWHSVAGVFNNGSLDIYVNGVLDNGTVTGENQGTFINTNAYNFVWIGALVRSDQSFDSQYFQGLIDEVAIFNHALTADEIASIYNASTAGICMPTKILTVTKTGTGGGTVTPNAGTLTWIGNNGTGSFSTETIITLTASPDTGSVFDGWSGSGCSGTGDCVLTMTADTTVTALFTPEVIPLTPTEGTIGTELAIAGSGFGDKKGKVLIGDAATKIAKDGWNDGKIICTVTKALPAGVYEVKVNSKVGTTNLPDGFTIMGPAIGSIVPDFGIPGDTITVSGSYFGSKKGKVYLEYQDKNGQTKKKNCKVTYWNMNPTSGASEIRFMVPNGLEWGTYQLFVSNKVGISESEDFILSSGASDRNLKENVERVEGREVLTRLAGITVSTWNYKNKGPYTRHIGPMAQDFKVAFNVGESDRYINMIDSGGVAMASIQGLYSILQERESEIKDLRTENLELREEMRAIGRRLAAIESSQASKP